MPEDSHVSRTPLCIFDSCLMIGLEDCSFSSVETVSGYPFLAAFDEKAIFTSHSYFLQVGRCIVHSWPP